MALMFRTRPASTLLMGLPLFHVGGALTHGLQQLGAGGTLVVLSAQGWRNKAAMPNIWRLVERYRPELLAGVPTVLGAVLNAPIEGHEVSSIKKVSGGGSAIPVPVADAYKHRFGLPVLETYGMTEASSCHTISYPERPVYLGSVGHPLPYSRVRVVEVDDKGKFLRDCPTDKIGVVTMHGPGVFSGYATGAPDAPFVEPGWVNSGDLGRVDANGYLWITGRAKDLIIRGGHNIDPLGIEEVLYEHPAVAVAPPRRRARRLRRRAAGGLRAAEGRRQRRPAPRCSSTPRHARPSGPPCRCSCTSSTRFRSRPSARCTSPRCAPTRPSAPCAACSTFVPASGCKADVALKPHKEHGTMIHVRLSGGPAAAREAVTRR
jgi:acyl-CoA synthetase (AMP-forming)/AMP-acid ligase II